MDTYQNDNPLIGELFIDAICDVGFKKIMSDETILVNFLNTFLPDDVPEIISATLLPEERQGDEIDGKKVFFDVRAKDNAGKTYIIEVQRKAQDFFVNRTIYYNSREISSQGKSGELKSYDFSPVYNISVLNFIPKEDWVKSYYDVFFYKSKYTNKELTNVTAQIFILLPLMELSPEELKDNRAKWCYLLRNAVKLNKEGVRKLKWTEEPVFEKMKQSLYVAKLTKEERAMIDRRQQIEWDNRAYEDYLERVGVEKGLQKGIQKGREEGHEEGLLEGLIATAKKMLQDGFDIKIISKYVDLSEDKILELKDSMENCK